MNADILHCHSCAIRHGAVCDALSDAQLRRLNQIARRRVVPAGQALVTEGERADFFANVVSGVIKLTKTLADGRQHIVGLLFPPDFLGRAFREESPYHAETATETEICSFPRGGFERMLKDYPELEHRLFELTLDELDACREWSLLLGRKTAEERVASFLLMIARRAPNIGCQHRASANFNSFTLPLARTDMADYLGLTIETVSRQMTRLKSEGIIGLPAHREVVVPDIARLAAAANLDPGDEDA